MVVVWSFIKWKIVLLVSQENVVSRRLFGKYDEITSLSNLFTIVVLPQLILSFPNRKLLHLVIEHLPQELRDRFTEMREMDLQVQSIVNCFFNQLGIVK